LNKSILDLFNFKKNFSEKNLKNSTQSLC